MGDLLDDAAELWRATGAGGDLRLVGGLAVRLYVGSAARVTGDIDVAAMNDATRARLLDHLRATGFVVGESGGWWRAARAGDPRRIVDVAGNPIVSPKTFETFTLGAAAEVRTVDGVEVTVAAPDDLARLKLAAARDQDLVDLLLLAHATRLSPVEIARGAQADDAERAVSAGAIRARHGIASGALAEAAEELLGRPAGAAELDALRSLLDGLAREGL